MRSGGPDIVAVEVNAAGRVMQLHQRLPAESPGVTQVRLPGAWAAPGLRDAHVHLAWLGRSSENVGLRGATSVEEVRQRIDSWLTARGGNVGRVVGSGWDHTLMPGATFPRASDLPKTPEIVLSRVDGHAIWVNEALLPLVAAHLQSGTKPPGERVLVDASGAPTGVIVDASEALWARLKSAPSPSATRDLERQLRAGLRACANAGLVGVHDMATSVAELDALSRIRTADGGLPVDVVVYLDHSDASFAWLERHRGPARVLGPDLRVVGVKLFADGALGSRGAALKAPYSDEPAHHGQPADTNRLSSHAKRTHELGGQLAIHAIGDLGNANALDAIEAAQGTERSRRHRVEHAQIVDLADLQRFRSLAVVASMQPTHATSDMRWAEARVGPERIAGAYAWQTLAQLGVPLALGSDTPVESHRPALGIYAALTRTDADGQPSGGWRPHERLSLAEALAGFSDGVAFAAGLEQSRGDIAIGKRFAVTLFAQDLRDAGPEAWRDVSPLGTVRDTTVRPRRASPSK